MPLKNNAAPRTPDCHPDRKHLAKGLCKQCYDHEYSAKNRDRLNEKARTWAASHPERRRVHKRRYLYDIDEPTVIARLVAQDGLCKICNTEKATDLDHDHDTGIARSLLCRRCNTGLGMFRENRTSLARAIMYLDLWSFDDPDDRAVQVIPNTGRRADGEE